MKNISCWNTTKLLLIVLPAILAGQVLDMPEVIQEQDEWCWAGVSCSILQYYGQPLSQCEIAEYTRTHATWHDFGSVNCCTDPNQGCNYWNYNWGYEGSIEDILQHWGVNSHGVGSALGISEIQTVVGSGSPFVIRWAWTSGGGHFLVGHGIIDTTIYYMDPWFGEGLKIANYSWVVSDANHTWAHTNIITSPPAPTLTSPANSAADQPLSLSMTWNAVSGASTYRVQLSANSDFSSTVVDDSTLTSPSKAVGPLSTSTTYYWRVNAKNTDGTSAWSDVWSFTTVPPATAAPTLTSPTNSATDQPLSLSMTWNAVSGASTYRVQLSANSDFGGTVVDDSTLTSAAKDVGPLSASTTYYWRVNAKNAGGTSTWSDVWSFTTVPPATAAPTLTSPTNSATDQPLSLSITWNAVSGASTYRVQLSANSDFGSTVVDDSTLTTAAKDVGPLATSTTYYWRVNAKNAGGISSWSEVWSFTTVPPATAVPTLTSPTNSATDQPLSLSMTWNAVSGASTYRVQLSANSDFGSTVVDDSTLTSAAKDVGPLSASTTYYWRVNARNAGGTSAWSEVWDFNTIPPVPDQVSLVSPSNTTVITIDSIVFSWSRSSTSVDKYCLEIFTDSLMASRTLIDSTITDTVKNQKNLQNKTAYWWRVKAHNIAGWGTASDISRFFIDIPIVGVLPAKYSCILSGMSKSGSLIKYGLPTTSNVSIKLYSIQGKLLKVMSFSHQQPGYYHVPIGITGFSKGYFILDFKAGTYTISKRISNL